MEHLRLVLRGRRRAWSTFIEVGSSPATSEAFGCRPVLRGRRSTWSTSGSFCMAGAAFGAPWSAEVRRRVMLLGTASFCLRGGRRTWSNLHRGRRKSGDASFCVAGAALGAPQARLARQAHLLEHLRLVLRGGRSTWEHLGRRKSGDE